MSKKHKKESAINWKMVVITGIADIISGIVTAIILKLLE